MFARPRGSKQNAPLEACEEATLSDPRRAVTARTTQYLISDEGGETKNHDSHQKQLKDALVAFLRGMILRKIAVVFNNVSHGKSSN
jgi:hypothetical protein